MPLFVKNREFMIITMLNVNGANNQDKGFEGNKKEILHLFSPIEDDLQISSLDEKFASEKIFANYYISKIKNLITDYYENKIEIQGLINNADNNNK